MSGNGGIHAQGLKAFILRGSVIDLATGVAIGAAFVAVITSFTENLLTPLLAIPGDTVSFSELSFSVSGSEFRYGAVIGALISFLIVATTILFLVVRPVNALMARRTTAETSSRRPVIGPECLSAIPVAARRCAFCTAEVVAGG